ncbi:hypothetical protein PAERUG_P58_London_29_09_13_02418 [Pseudomonas aeruginosa]|nr:hypothetical protein PAERUG_P58_London_29_09_13_02418 [Pseudomonas aeruginosa]
MCIRDRFGSPAEFAAVARLDHRRARRHAVDGDGGRRAAVAGGVPGHHIDHGAIRQLATGGEAPVAVGIGAGLADRIAVAVGDHDGHTRFRRTTEDAAVAGIDLGRVGEVGGFGGDRGAVVAGRVGNDHRHRLAIGQRRVQRDLEVAVGTDHHGGVRLAVAIGIDAHRRAGFGLAGDAAAVRRHLHVGSRRRGGSVRSGDLGRRAGVASRVGDHHGDRLAIGQRRVQRSGEIAVGIGDHGEVRLAVAIGIDADARAGLGLAADAAAVRRYLQAAGRLRRSGVRGHRRTAAATAAAAVGNRHPGADGRRTDQQRSPCAHATEHTGAGQRLETGQAFLRDVAGHQRPVGSDRRQIYRHQLVLVGQEQLAGRLAFRIEVGDADAFPGLQLDDQVRTALRVSRHRLRCDIERDITALGEFEYPVFRNLDGSRRRNTLIDRGNFRLDRHFRHSSCQAATERPHHVIQK